MRLQHTFDPLLQAPLSFITPGPLVLSLTAVLSVLLPSLPAALRQGLYVRAGDLGQCVPLAYLTDWLLMNSFGLHFTLVTHVYTQTVHARSLRKLLFSAQSSSVEVCQRELFFFLFLRTRRRPFPSVCHITGAARRSLLAPHESFS